MHFQRFPEWTTALRLYSQSEGSNWTQPHFSRYPVALGYMHSCLCFEPSLFQKIDIFMANSSFWPFTTSFRKETGWLGMIYMNTNHDAWPKCLPARKLTCRAVQFHQRLGQSAITIISQPMWFRIQQIAVMFHFEWSGNHQGSKHKRSQRHYINPPVYFLKYGSHVFIEQYTIPTTHVIWAGNVYIMHKNSCLQKERHLIKWSLYGNRIFIFIQQLSSVSKVLKCRKW